MTAQLDVAAWRPEPLLAAQHQLALARVVLDAALAELATTPSVAWRGVAAEAAAGLHLGLVDDVRAMAQLASAVAGALTVAAEQLATVTMSFEPSGAADVDTARTAQAVQVALRVDTELAAALGRLTGAIAVTEGSPLAQPTPQVDSAPLAATRRSASVVDTENRIRLDRAEADLTANVAALQPAARSWDELLTGVGGSATIGSFGGGRRRVAYQQAVAKLAAVRATRQVLDQPDGRTRQLLAFDVSGRTARVAVAVGDIDRAQHVAVVVPGFTTTVERDLTGSDRLAADLAEEGRRAAALIGDHRDVAVVSWLGYDIPQAADTLRDRHSVVSRRSAEDGAAILDGFLRDLPPDRHLTLVGHSYGSTTAGLAVARPGTPVDDLVVLGSPGLGVNRTADLGLPPGHTHVLEADDDPVADLAWFGPDPDEMAGVDRLETGAARLPDETEGQAATGHSRYLAPGTTSQWNVAAVVVGAPLVRAGRPPPSW